MKNFIKSFICRASVYYSAIVIVFSFIVLLSHPDDASIALDPRRILFIFPFCACFAIANTTLKYKNIQAVTRWLVHIVLTVGGAFLFLILPAELTSSSGNFMGFFIILVVYFLGVAIFALFRKRIRSTIEEDKKLKSGHK